MFKTRKNLINLVIKFNVVKKPYYSKKSKNKSSKKIYQLFFCEILIELFRIYEIV